MDSTPRYVVRRGYALFAMVVQSLHLLEGQFFHGLSNRNKVGRGRAFVAGVNLFGIANHELGIRLLVKGDMLHWSLITRHSSIKKVRPPFLIFNTRQSTNSHGGGRIRYYQFMP